MSSVVRLIKKYQDLVLYVVFGVLTTAVNMVSYWFASHVLLLPTVPSTVIAWIAAVLFAYVTNRKWVFHSEARGKKQIIAEIVSFFSCRLLTGFLDTVCMYVFVDLLHWNDLIVKMLANVFVVILNFIASKLLIFKKRS